MRARDLFSDDDFSDDAKPAQRHVLRVWELTAQIKDLLETSFPSVWVTGEISNLSRPRSGHVYLTLKDDRAQLRAILWRNTADRLRFDLHDGLEAICRGHLDVYAPRGSYQFVVEQIEPKGIGTLELAFRQLREKLGREGLFEPGRKRPLPDFVRRIAVVTSPSGAAIHDFLQVLGRRWRGADVLVVPTRVQGEGAAEEIAAAIALVQRLRAPIDCLVVTRGGGSLEDLWAFNEEPVVRAIAASPIPVVSAIGHEIDVTLSDLAADVRALTPSEAAELVTPDTAELVARLRQYQRQLLAALRTRATAARTRWNTLAQHHTLRRPFQRIHDLSRRLDELEGRGSRAVRGRARHARQQADRLAAQLESLSPLGVLSRGYSLTQRTTDGRLVRNAADLALGEQITSQFACGEAVSRVEQIRG
ncbi:MAG: exodeoxyribonuclease VII large subunit [Pirellulales bacterium]|nr:exodeoxyribonuclease VII large subunit [Pirellulales bacterium]